MNWYILCFWVILALLLPIRMWWRQRKAEPKFSKLRPAQQVLLLMVTHAHCRGRGLSVMMYSGINGNPDSVTLSKAGIMARSLQERGLVDFALPESRDGLLSGYVCVVLTDAGVMLMRRAVSPLQSIPDALPNPAIGKEKDGGS